MWLARPALALVNHLLTSEPWARERLASFAGRTACLQVGSNAAWLLRIGEAGLLESAAPGTPAAVSIRLPEDAPARALVDRASLFSSATISGTADAVEFGKTFDVSGCLGFKIEETKFLISSAIFFLAGIFSLFSIPPSKVIFDSGK